MKIQCRFFLSCLTAFSICFLQTQLTFAGDIGAIIECAKTAIRGDGQDSAKITIWLSGSNASESKNISVAAIQGSAAFIGATTMSAGGSINPRTSQPIKPSFRVASQGTEDLVIQVSVDSRPAGQVKIHVIKPRKLDEPKDWVKCAKKVNALFPSSFVFGPAGILVGSMPRDAYNSIFPEFRKTNGGDEGLNRTQLLIKDDKIYTIRYPDKIVEYASENLDEPNRQMQRIQVGAETYYAQVNGYGSIGMVWDQNRKPLYPDGEPFPQSCFNWFEKELKKQPGHPDRLVAQELDLSKVGSLGETYGVKIKKYLEAYVSGVANDFNNKRVRGGGVKDYETIQKFLNAISSDECALNPLLDSKREDWGQQSLDFYRSNAQQSAGVCDHCH